MKYGLMLAGLLTMCVPDDAGFLRFALQGSFGLLLFVGGVALALKEEEYA
jgi:hypothetical protein